jgi:cytochrome oxidase Cu insertion factor (SCO1/SenC/PrrC family)
MSKQPKSSRIKRTKPSSDDFVPTFIRVDPNDPNSPILEATVKDNDGDIIRIYMSPPKGGE